MPNYMIKEHHLLEPRYTYVRRTYYLRFLMKDDNLAYFVYSSFLPRSLFFAFHSLMKVSRRKKIYSSTLIALFALVSIIEASGLDPFQPIRFKNSKLQWRNGSTFQDDRMTASVVGPDNRYFVGSLPGFVHVLTLSSNEKVTDYCRSTNPDTKLSGAILVAPVDKKGFNGTIFYDNWWRP